MMRKSFDKLCSNVRFKIIKTQKNKQKFRQIWLIQFLFDFTSRTLASSRVA